MTPSDPTASGRWWLKLQVGLASAGGLIWLAGAMFENDFASGVGLGLIAAALVLRIGRRAADEAENDTSAFEAGDGSGAASSASSAQSDTAAEN